jgi:hypothetical protein
MQKLISDTFYDPKYGMQSATKLYNKLRDKGITLKQVKDFIEKQEGYQLNKQPVKVKHYFPIVAKYENEIFQVDLADMSDITTTNSYYRWLLCCVDVFTRKAYVVPMKNKTSISVTTAMHHVIEQSKPVIINCDQGSEFISREFKQLASDNSIDIRYVPVGDHHKLAIVDRFIRTLRQLINNYQTVYKTTRYIDVLDKLVDNYNNTYHSGIKGIPNKPESKRLLAITRDKYNKALGEEKHFKVGQTVRFLKNKLLFEKGSSNAKWSNTVHTIVGKTEHTYTLDNDGVYKYYELMPVDIVESKQIRVTRQKAKEPTKEQLKKTNTNRRRLNREGLTITDIVDTKRIRAPTKRFTY